ncbi:putative RWD domain-containing protein 4 [Hypsibius exemplaris]|uniref:RWD domain-containing protein 4 n=1 Tax=Hypsibius exemplaris TaxID=2072580 RepID=A0A9X6RM36_HYPEX|nr:putative RWD domain-containing protein 4 [Hypsibius exemplaris]
MDLEIQKSDEREVLSSIYSGDDHFQMVDENSFQYRVEPNGDPRNPKRFMLQIRWPDTYPESVPEVNLDIFYNSHLHNSDKEEVKRRVLEEAAAWVGCAMTYTLFEFAKENWDSLISETSVVETRVEEKRVTGAEKRELLAAADDDDKPRGWNWVDVVKHLFQVPGEVK